MSSRDRFTPIAMVVMWFLDVLLNSLLEPVSAHISVVILLTCLQVRCVVVPRACTLTGDSQRISVGVRAAAHSRVCVRVSVRLRLLPRAPETFRVMPCIRV